MKHSPFHNMMYRTIVSAIVGIVTGLALGIFIWGLAEIVQYLNSLVYQMPNPGYDSFANSGPFTLSGFTTLGMCFGAIIGAIHGGAFAINENKKKA